MVDNGARFKQFRVQEAFDEYANPLGPERNSGFDRCFSTAAIGLHSQRKTPASSGKS